MENGDGGLKFELEHIRFLYQNSNPRDWGDLIDATKLFNDQLFDMTSEALHQMVQAFDHLNLIGEPFSTDPEQVYEMAKQHVGHNFQPTSSMPVGHGYAGVLGGEVSKASEESDQDEKVINENSHPDQAADESPAEKRPRSWLDRLMGW